MNVANGLHIWALRTPHQVALIEDGRPFSFRTCDDAVWRAISDFRRAGIAEGTVVGIGGGTGGALHLIASFALARMGAVQVPLSPQDPASRTLDIVRRTGMTALLGRVADGGRMNLIVPTLDPGWFDQRKGPPDRFTVTAGGDNVYIVNHSSGTTGRPKAMAITHAMEADRTARQPQAFSSRPGERFMSVTSLGFTTGMSRAMRCLSDGGTVVAAPNGMTFANLAEAIERYNVTHLSCTPKDIHDILEHIPEPVVRFPGLRIVRVSTAALPPAVLARARQHINPNIYCNYGTNEAGGIAVATPEILDRAPNSVGRLLPGVELELVDDRDMPIPAGETGLVRVRTGGMIDGYLDQPEATAAAFRNGWFYPGDMATFDADGLLHLKGRIDEMMNYDGILVSPLEIEQALLEHPAVADAAAFAVPSDRHQDAPGAAVVLQDDISFEELNAHCIRRLGIRKPMIFLRFDTLPRNPIGKVLKSHLVTEAQTMLAKRRQNS